MIVSEWRGVEGGITKAQEKIGGDDGYVHYLECGDGFTRVSNFDQIVHFR